ncbi:MAG: phosphoenolpyruvate synthase [Gammaproteobacteria bacterium]|nr:phosphoenolpyruvate synthase [Gammaproteobacteria bacterium]
MKWILNFNEIDLTYLPQVGGKNASLGEMIAKLSTLGIHVPKGFATVSEAYREFLKANKIDKEIDELLKNLDPDDLVKLKKISGDIRKLILNAPFSKTFESEVAEAFQQLNLNPNQTVAVRSSATAEDLLTASFAGQQESYLNVSGIDNILISIKRVYASLFTERAISYRFFNHFDHQKVAISAGIQQMIRSDCGSSGVIFTIDTESGFDQVVFISASYGLGEMVVQGNVNPDEFYVHKPTLKTGKDSIISRKCGSKKVKMIYAESQDYPVQMIETNKNEQQQFCLSDHDVLELARYALIIENHYGKAMDIEWAKDGIDNALYIIQARPETVKMQENKNIIEQYHILKKEKPIIMGRSIGQKIGQGAARKILDLTKMHEFQQGEILVADTTNPDWEPIMKRAAAIVTNHGGRTCHAAIVAREMGIPAVVGCTNATDILSDGEEITVSCAEGETGYVYPGLLNYNVEKTEIENLGKIPVKLCLNLANPEQAFGYQFLPNDGIGLARLEFIIGSMIGIHPNAVLHPEMLSEKIQAEINEKTAAYESPVEFYIEKLAEGIATISAAFYPKPVIVRFSDFKSNEYANLMGGDFFEPAEENPMIGYRGGSRYISGNFQECFKLECEAIKRVREKKGLINTQVMFPFVRTVDEIKKLISVTKKNGLERGVNELKIYMMCEIPSNALLAESFLAHVDGYSIGSNDLTQLTLGLDRDSELVADLFDERNEAVKILLHQIISTCKKLKKYIGICGQGPSDHPDLAQWLMQEGIESLSLSPDSIVRTWQMLGK